MGFFPVFGSLSVGLDHVQHVPPGRLVRPVPGGRGREALRHVLKNYLVLSRGIGVVRQR